MARKTADGSATSPKTRQVASAELSSVIFAIQGEINKYFKRPDTRCETSPTPAPEDSGRKRLVTKIRVDELVTR